MFFPHSNPVHITENLQLDADRVIEFLAPMLTDNRKEKIKETINHRSYSIIPVLEKIHDQGNINAVLRSAESFGFQNVQIIEAEKYKKANRVSKGAHKWLDLSYFQNTKDCIQQLKHNGYKILVTHLSDTAIPISECDFSSPTAIVLGSEGLGASEEVLEMADQNIIIPMSGFTQSFNISVAAAITFYHAKQDKLQRTGYFGDLTDEQKKILIANYYLRSVPDSELKLEEILKKL